MRKIAWCLTVLTGTAKMEIPVNGEFGTKQFDEKELSGSLELGGVQRCAPHFMPEGDYIHVRRAGRGVGIEPMFTNVARSFVELDRFWSEPSRLQSAAGRIAGPEIWLQRREDDMELTWAGWASVSEGSSTPGGRVAAVPWGNNIALFLADPSGGIYTALGDPQAGFGPWRSVSEGSSTPGAPVTAIPWGNNIALFLADPNGGIYTALGDPQAGFGPWRSVSEGSSTPGAPVTAIPWGNSIALFIADPNGGIYTALGDPNYAADHVDHGVNFAGFGPWRSVSEGRSTPGAPVTAIPWGNEHRPVYCRSRRWSIGVGGPQLRSRPCRPCGSLCRLWALEERGERQQHARRAGYRDSVGK